MRLEKCRSRNCERRVPVGINHCCPACASAHEGGYEIHESGPLAHSPDCDTRDRERRPWAYTKATEHTDAEMAAAELVVATRLPGWKTLKAGEAHEAQSAQPAHGSAVAVAAARPAEGGEG